MWQCLQLCIHHKKANSQGEMTTCGAGCGLLAYYCLWTFSFLTIFISTSECYQYTIYACTYHTTPSRASLKFHEFCCLVRFSTATSIGEPAGNKKYNNNYKVDVPLCISSKRHTQFCDTTLFTFPHSPQLASLAPTHPFPSPTHLSHLHYTPLPTHPK